MKDKIVLYLCNCFICCLLLACYFVYICQALFYYSVYNLFTLEAVFVS